MTYPISPDHEIPREALDELASMPAHVQAHTIAAIVDLIHVTHEARLGRPVRPRPTPSPVDRPAIRGLGTNREETPR